MKIRFSKSVLAKLPAPIRAIVEKWRADHGKAFFSLRAASKFYIEEDARYTAFSADLATSTSIRAGGEWAGHTGLRPGSDCPLPPGCTVVASGFFCGHPWLTIYHNPEASTSTVRQLCDAAA